MAEKEGATFALIKIESGYLNNIRGTLGIAGKGGGHAKEKRKKEKTEVDTLALLCLPIPFHRKGPRRGHLCRFHKPREKKVKTKIKK